MANEFRLGDGVRVGTVRETVCTFQQMAEQFESAGVWISENIKRTDEAFTLFNLLVASAGYLKVVADNINKHISVIALGTRNLYEINLQTRNIISSVTGLRRWHAEWITDRIQILEGVLELATLSDTSGQRKVISREIDRLKSLRDRNRLPDAGPSGAKKIAKSVGLLSEHRALFKLFSKLVHPSSYLVNDYKNAASDEIAMIPQIHAQLYAWDTFSRICDKVSMPQSVRRKLEGERKT